jgi:hypothetical protein
MAVAVAHLSISSALRAEESLYTLAERVVGKRCWLLGKRFILAGDPLPLPYLLVSDNQ